MDKTVVFNSYDDVVRELGADEAAELLSDALYTWDWISAEDIKTAHENNSYIYIDHDMDATWEDRDECKSLVEEALAETDLHWADGFKADTGNAYERLRSDLVIYLTGTLEDRYSDSNSDINMQVFEEFSSALKHAAREHGYIAEVGESLEYDILSTFGLDFNFKVDETIDSLSFETTLMLYENSPEVESDLIDAVIDWDDKTSRYELKDNEYALVHDANASPFVRPADIPHTVFDSLCESQGTTIEKVINNPQTKFEKSFHDDLIESRAASMFGLAVMCELDAKDFITACAAMDQNHEQRGSAEVIRSMIANPGKYEPIIGVYDPYSGCAGLMGIKLDKPFEINPKNILWSMSEPDHGQWESDICDLYTPQDCCGFVSPFAGRLECKDATPRAVSPEKSGLERYRDVADLLNGTHSASAVDDINH